MNRRTFGKALVASLLGPVLITESKPFNVWLSSKYPKAQDRIQRMGQPIKMNHCPRTIPYEKGQSVGFTDFSMSGRRHTLMGIDIA